MQNPLQTDMATLTEDQITVNEAFLEEQIYHHTAQHKTLIGNAGC